MKNPLIKCTLILLLNWIFSYQDASASSAICESLFTTVRAPSLTPGKDLGPIEWLSNIKLKIKTSKTLKNFDDQKYQNSLKHIQQENLRVEDGFMPESREEYVAYLDASLVDLNLSILKMDPVIRNKIYKTVDRVLRTQGQTANQAADKISNLVFRGSYQKPTSFRYLLTHLPKDAAAEMFTQHLHKLIITQIVTQAFRFNLESSSSSLSKGKLGRFIPKWLSERKEVANLAFFTAFDITNSIITGQFTPILTPFDLLNLKRNKDVIETSLANNGIDGTFISLESKFENKNQFNYYYAVVKKSLNWYFIGYVLAPFFIN